MFGFSTISDQVQPVLLLRSFIRNRTVPHALLFTGAQGVGKQDAAKRLAMALNCCDPVAPAPDNSKNPGSFTDPCGKCRSCVKIISGTHPDIIHIRPKGAFIRIDQIRNLLSTLSMKPYEAAYRVVIISDADAMNPESGNALLKMLEEPPDRTILVLNTRQRSDLLPTVVSRCRHIRFNPISRKRLKQYLVDRKDMAPETAGTLAGFSNGSLSRALDIDKNNWLTRRDWLIDAAGLDQPGEMTHQPENRLFAFSEKLARKKEGLDDDLEGIKSWLMDLLVFSYAPQKVVNRDRLEIIKRVSKTVKKQLLIAQYGAVQKAQKKLRANANPRLTLDVMMLQIKDAAEKFR